MGMNRHRTRQLVLQAVYQWQMLDQPMSEIITQFLHPLDAEGVKALSQIDPDYFRDMLRKISNHREILDEHLQPLLSRSLQGLDNIERAILRIGACELIYYPETPYRVVLNEAIELAKQFGAEQGHRYVNGVLDRLAKEIRRVEKKPKDSAGLS
jgi:transcription antitermination protein NusB